MKPELDKPTDRDESETMPGGKQPQWEVAPNTIPFDDETVFEQDDHSITPDDTAPLPALAVPSVSQLPSPNMPTYMRQFPSHVHGLAIGILENDVGSGKRHDQRCQPSLVSTFDAEYLTLVFQDIKSCNLFDITEDTESEAAHDLGKLLSTLKRQWDENRLKSEALLSLLRINHERIDKFAKIIKSPLLPAQALIPVERQFRTEFLPDLQKDFSGHIPPALPSEDVSRLGAVVMSAYYAHPDHAEDLLKWTCRYPHDLGSAANKPRFQNRLRLILDDARTIAEDDAPLQREIARWPCPTENCEPFLRYFVPLFNERYFTWFIPFVANIGKMYQAG